MADPTNTDAYLESLSAELLSQANRVRNLIGDRHWLSDGSHKELILADVLRRHLPDGVKVTRGFVVGTTPSRPVSRELDLLLLDTTEEAPLFQAGDLAIAFPHKVLAAISVKTKLATRELADTWDNLQSLRQLSLAACPDHHPWTGGFFFDCPRKLAHKPGKLGNMLAHHFQRQPLPQTAIDKGQAYPRALNMVASANGLAAILDYSDATDPKAQIHQTGPLSAAVFVANIVEHVHRERTGRSSSLASVLNSTFMPTQIPHVQSLGTKQAHAPN